MPPSASTLERLVRRDRAVVGAALTLLALLAWAYVIQLAAHTGDAGLSGMATPAMMRPELKEWSAADGAFMFTMWAVMMAAMMTPSAGPMVLIHARVARQALAGGKPFATTGWFAAG
jgi:predicted metal-binding membrane protein